MRTKKNIQNTDDRTFSCDVRMTETLSQKHLRFEISIKSQVREDRLKKKDRAITPYTVNKKPLIPFIEYYKND